MSSPPSKRRRPNETDEIKNNIKELFIPSIGDFITAKQISNVYNETYPYLPTNIITLYLKKAFPHITKSRIRIEGQRTYQYAHITIRQNVQDDIATQAGNEEANDNAGEDTARQTGTHNETDERACQTDDENAVEERSSQTDLQGVLQNARAERATQADHLSREDEKAGVDTASQTGTHNETDERACQTDDENAVEERSSQTDLQGVLQNAREERATQADHLSREDDSVPLAVLNLFRISEKSIVFQKHLCTGSFAKVVVVKEIATENRYVKKICTEVPQSEEEIINEARMMLILRPCSFVPNVIGFNLDNRFLVMDYVDGRDLFQAASGGVLKTILLTNIINVFRQIVTAVLKIHQHGILHNDLHSCNVMISTKGTSSFNVFVVDFGKACLVANGKSLNVPPKERPRWLKSFRWIDPDMVTKNAPQTKEKDMYSVGHLMKDIQQVLKIRNATLEAAGLMLRTGEVKLAMKSLAIPYL